MYVEYNIYRTPHINKHKQIGKTGRAKPITQKNMFKPKRKENKLQKKREELLMFIMI